MKQQMIKTIGLSLLTSTILLGANIPNIGDIEKQIQVPKIQKEKTLIPEVSSKVYQRPMKDSGKTIFVKSFTFSGNVHISNEKIQELAKKYENKDLTFTQINKLSSSITKLYREKGYFVARSYLPKQNIQNSIIKIEIIEGNYGEFHLKNNSLVKNSIVQGMLDDAKRDNIVSTSTIERSMLIINDTAGVKVTGADVIPGKKVGTSDFTVTTQATKKYDGYIIADNEGSRYTGKNRLMVGINLNSPFKIGDKISLSGLISDGTDLKNGAVTYTVPLMANGLNGKISYSQTNYSLVEEYKNLRAKGSSKNLSATLSYPIIRTKIQNLYTTLEISKKDLKDEVDSTNDKTQKDINSISFGLDYDQAYLLANFNTQSEVKFNLTHGKLNFSDDVKKQVDETGANTNGNYSKINLDINHNMAFTNKITLESSLKMQYALGNKNLDGSEDFSIGGQNGVKLYPSGEISAENGYIFNIEGKYSLPSFKNISNTVGVFYDVGRTFMANNNVGFQARILQDIGVGYYGSYKDFFGKLQVAWKIDNEEISSEPNRNSRILFQGGFVF